MLKKRFVDADPIDVAQERVDRGRAFLQKALLTRPELIGHTVKDTIADGMCFLHAIVLQLGLD